MKSTDYLLMRLSEADDEDAFDPADLEKEELSFDEQYKAFYSDIKTSIKEDW